MKRIITLAFLTLLMSILCTMALAQEKTQAYYVSHQTEILPDAQAAFRKGEYELAEKLCSWHYIIVGDKRADALREKAEKCAKLAIEMNTLSSFGNQDAVREKARAILALNPDDKTAQQFTTSGSLKVASSPSGAAIWLDGKNTKLVTPDIVEDLPPGKHTVKLVLDGYQDYSGSVTVTSGTQVELTQTLAVKEQPAQTTVQEPQQWPAKGTINGHEWVDLGLSVKWATCNVGASSPSDYGRYFAWGETKPKGEYTWETYKYRESGDVAENVTFSKYNTQSAHGTVDNKKRLDTSDDAARTNWGGTWRMPTYSEWDELKTKCTWTWTTQGGKNGYKVTSKTNGNSIFLPAAGNRNYTHLSTVGSLGFYWSSSLDTDRPYFASIVYFVFSGCDWNSSSRYLGFSVRPVSE